MKKIIIACGMLLLGGALRAGTPLDQNPQAFQGPYSNATLFASSWTTSGASTQIVFPATTKASSGTTFSGRNCLTSFTVQLSTGSQFYILDGGATDYYLNGVSLGSSSLTETFRATEDRLGPLCGTAGNSLILSIPATTGGTIQTINAEGFTYFPPAINAGQ